MAFNVGSVKIEFSHPEIDSRELFEDWSIMIPKGETRRCTIATMISLETGDVLNYGVSVCNKLDNFNKSLGRKNALTHALEMFKKDFRKEVWNEYNKQIQNKVLCRLGKDKER